MGGRRTKRVIFEGSQHRMVGILDYPEDAPAGAALYVPCFTCGKDIKAAARICKALAERDIAVLRFDFPGLGESSGEFETTNFSQNCDDVVRAAEFMQAEIASPKLLLGHSLGGAACLRVANQISSVRGVVTLAAPSDTKHLAEHLEGRNSQIQGVGKGAVNIGGRDFVISEQLVEDLRKHDLRESIEQLRAALLILHSPVDETLGFHHAQRIYDWAPQPKSIVSLDGSDHLFVNQAGDIEFISLLIESWAKRYAFGES